MYSGNRDTRNARDAATLRYSSISTDRIRRNSALLWSAYIILWIGVFIAVLLSSTISNNGKFAVWLALIAHALYMWITADFAIWLWSLPKFVTRTVSVDEI